MLSTSIKKAAAKTLAAGTLAMSMVLSFAAPAFAAAPEIVPMNGHQDRTITFVFNSSNNQQDETTWETKEDNTNTYIVAINNSLPVGGFTVQTQTPGLFGVPTKASKGEYRINDYNEHSIRNDAVGNMAGKQVRIVGRYQNMAYTYGDVTAKWSPDTYGNVPSLN